MRPNFAHKGIGHNGIGKRDSFGVGRTVVNYEKNFHERF